MIVRRIARCLTLALVGGISSVGTTRLASAQDSESAIVGRWDVTVEGKSGSYPSWFEVRKSGATLVGAFVGQFGSARPVSQVTFERGAMRFSLPPQFEERKAPLVFEGQLDGELLRGETNDEKGATIRWTARRAPALRRDPPKSWGASIALIQGNDLTGWKPQYADRKNGWKVQEGVLINAEPGNNLLTEQKFEDFKLHAEFRYPRRSNSGIYLRGRYEFQIQDGFGREADSHEVGGIYGFLTPSFNAARPAGEWQSVDMTLVGRRLSVILNGQRIIDEQTIPGITGGALESAEGEPGPIMLQGDHGPVEYRQLMLSPGESG